MRDFLKAAKQTASETITVAGTKIEVRGLTVRELSAISKPNGKAERNPEELSIDLIVACCFTADGKPLIPLERKSEVGDISPVIFKALNEAVARVNGFISGNSNATDGDASSFA